MTNRNDSRPVLVTTAHRGVFFGYLMGEPSKAQVVLNRARNVTYWDAATRSFMGLAGQGPSPQCRISPAAGDSTTLYDITAVVGCTPEAVEKFEVGPWA